MLHRAVLTRRIPCGGSVADELPNLRPSRNALICTPCMKIDDYHYIYAPKLAFCAYPGFTRKSNVSHCSTIVYSGFPMEATRTCSACEWRGSRDVSAVAIDGSNASRTQRAISQISKICAYAHNSAIGGGRRRITGSQAPPGSEWLYCKRSKMTLSIRCCNRQSL